MVGKPRARFFMLALAMLAMMAALIWKLSDITLANGAYYAGLADQRRTTTTYTTGARGRILDRNGIPLAYDETSYNVQFSRDPEKLSDADSALYTESLIRAINIIEAGGGTIIDTFFIVEDESQPGTYKYNWGVTSETAVKARYKNFCQAMGLSMGAPEDADNMDAWTSAEDAYRRLRAMWMIPVEMNFSQARKIMSIRQEVNLNKWRAYEAITISFNVTMDVVAQLDMLSDELPGISTVQSTTRIYPWGETAAHIVGYLSRQVNNTPENNLLAMGYTAEEINAVDGIRLVNAAGEPEKDENGRELLDMTKLGYSYNDYIGVAGVERTMERYLTASTYDRRGTQVVEVNKNRNVTRELERTYASNGNDVMLTIDLQLQQVTESALRHTIEQVRAAEEAAIAEDQAKPEEDRKYKNPDSIRMADAGSIVILDVHTGKTLSMASYPSFDPTVFLSPIDEANFKLLFGEGSGMPTLNRAIGTRPSPGSIFKMATGFAGLMEGAISTTEEITDQSPYNLHVTGVTIEDKDAPSCWAISSSRSMAKHANLNVSDALGVSCNYFFFTVADRIGIERLNAWAGRLGLSGTTGIELPGEISSYVGGQSLLYDNTKAHNAQQSSLPYYVYTQLKKYLESVVSYRGTEIDETAIDNCAQKLLQIEDGVIGDYGEPIRRILSEELNIPTTLTRSQRWEGDIRDMLYELRWKPTMTLRTGMGQGITSVTPVSVARYAATFVNGGSVFDVHVVDRIIDSDGKSVKVFEPTVREQIDAPEEYWAAIRKGLEAVVSDEDGTAARQFTDDFADKGYKDQLIGKSGSAQISMASNIIDIEATSWFVSYLPKESPEIVIITCIPYGQSGTSGSLTAVEEITRFYIDRKQASAKENLIQQNGLIP